MKNTIIVMILVCCLFTGVFAKADRKQPEKWYQTRWCKEQHGTIEVVLPDRTRCDCETLTHAIEFDFGRKWSEAVGQALYYALQLEKSAGVVLILENAEDYRYWIRLNTTVEHFQLPITTWKVENF